MMNTKILALDMDGTIYDLYGQEGWLYALENGDSTIFTTGQPLVNMEDLRELINKKQTEGWIVGVITWLPKEATPQYAEDCTRAKYQWLESVGIMDCLQFFSPLPYGTNKKSGLPFRAEYNVLVDDNNEVCQSWEDYKRKNVYKAVPVLTGYEQNWLDTVEDIE